VESDTEFETGKERGRPEELVREREKSERIEMRDESYGDGCLRGLLEGDDGCGCGGLLVGVATDGRGVVRRLVFGAVTAGRLSVLREVHAGCEAGDQRQQAEDSGEVA
jgi:hypothetical protein